MKKLSILSILLFLTLSLLAQFKLDVDGDMKLRGQLDLISTGFANMFIGEGTGNNTTNGKSNVFLGWSAGVNNTSGDDNTFVGTVAGLFSKTGSSNVPGPRL
jgi:hypothetical protein